jgi:hypothetical protein
MKIDFVMMFGSCELFYKCKLVHGVVIRKKISFSRALGEMVSTGKGLGRDRQRILLKYGLIQVFASS